jgi:thiol-disulfide isomerase/thioredoxin
LSASRLRLALAALACLAAGIPAFLKMTVDHAGARADRQLVVLDSQKWLGQPWPLAQYVDAWPELARGRWAVLLYSWSCGHCPEMVQAYGDLAADWQARGAAERVALIDTSVDETPAEVEKTLKQLPALHSRLQAPREWFITMPTVVVLKEGRVVAVAEGDEDCQWDAARLGRW